MTERDWDARADEKISYDTEQGVWNAPRCFAVMFFRPADRIAPAPSTT